MSKRIIVFSDGTWNEPENLEDDRIVCTNVLKMARAITPNDDENGLNQVVFYDEGVGTGSIGMVDKILGGGTGIGISKNICDCYRFLAHNYEDGDEIFLFGFSRGAYTVRSLTGLLSASGLLPKTDLDLLPYAYEFYRTPPDKRSQYKHRDKLAHIQTVRPKIQFLGVWDTVGALGVPTPLLKQVSKQWIGFHDEKLCDIVVNAYQALAIDERRSPFAPSIWIETQGQANVQQVWFAGVHSNVGGGYPDSGLSDIAFLWLANRAQEHGLVLNKDFLNDPRKVNPREDGVLVDSYTAGYKALKYLGVNPLQRPIARSEYVGEMIHESVIDRLQNSELQYRPANLVNIEGDISHLFLHEGDRDKVFVQGRKLAIFRERKEVRRQQQGLEATLILEDQTPQTCRVIDLSSRSGARLNSSKPIAPGAEGVLESNKTGRRPFRVVWCANNEMGVMFPT